MLRRFGTVGLSLAATAALAAASAQAKAYVVHYRDLPAVYVDDALCQFDGFAFNVNVNGVDDVTVRTQGTKTVTVDKFRGTVTGPNGVSLSKTEDAVITDDSVTGNQTWNGVAEAFSYSNGPAIAKDVGEITFDSSGNIISEHGPHPIADGPGNVAVCTALSS